MQQGKGKGNERGNVPCLNKFSLSMICYQITVELVSESSLPASTGIALKVKVKVKYRRNLTASRIYRNIYSYQLSLPPPRDKGHFLATDISVGQQVLSFPTVIG